MQRLYLVDFDRSLFDTARFQADIFRILSGNNPDRESQFIRTIPDFSNPDTGFYDFFEHAQAHTGLSHAQVLQLLQDGIPDNDYAFPDAGEWAEGRRGRNDTVILTVGGPHYQNLKFTYAPSLSHLPRHIINENKSRLLERELTELSTPPYVVSFAPGRFDEIVLLDDSAAHLRHLPNLPGVTGIHLVRPGGKYSHVPAPPGMQTISNLGELL